MFGWLELPRYRAPFFIHFAKVFLFNLEEAFPLLFVKNHFCSQLLSEKSVTLLLFLKDLEVHLCQPHTGKL